MMLTRRKVDKFLKSSWYSKGCAIIHYYRMLRTHVLYFMRVTFCGKNVIHKPLHLTCSRQDVLMERGAVIHELSWILVDGLPIDDFKLRIGENSQIGHFAHIVAFKHIVIGKNVLIADKVFISDIQHKYERTDVPILAQGIENVAPVNIGDGTWVGENVCILGASIGKNCVIGANAVVRGVIPDYCVVAGAPAKIIKKYNPDTKQWERVLD